MNWFGILKKDKVLPKMREFQFAGEGKNKPEVEDDRCRQALKEKIIYLKFFENYITNTSPISPYEVTTLYVGKGAGRRLEGQNLPNSYDHAMEALDSIPEEACCVFLELLQKCVQRGNSFLNTYWNKPHDKKKVRDMIKNDEASFYENREITIEGKKWDITCYLSGNSDRVDDHQVLLFIKLVPFDEFITKPPSRLIESSPEEAPFIEFDIIYPSQYDKQRQNFDLENSTPEKEMNTRWDLLRHVVKALELG